mgnify:FL=1
MTRLVLPLLLIGLAACEAPSPPVRPAMAAESAQAASAAVTASRRTAITDAVARVAPAVVTVQTERRERVAADEFDWFFGRRSAERSAASIGSGFILRADGLIITNAHVVSAAATVAVALRDGTTYPATVLGAD